MDTLEERDRFCDFEMEALLELPIVFFSDCSMNPLLFPSTP
jgi:hypothetical protein